MNANERKSCATCGENTDTTEFEGAEYCEECFKEAVRKADIPYEIELKFQCGNYYYHIFTACDEGYMYDRYNSKADFENGVDSTDGGQCTGTLNNAIEMALN